MRFDIGDKVIICKIPLGARGNIKYNDLEIDLCGTVQYASRGNFGVKIDNKYNHSSAKGLYYFKYGELQLLEENKQNNIYSKGDNNMKMTGNYRVAKVRLLGQDTTKRYAFALFDNNVNVGDTVLCDTQCGYNVAIVDEIISKDEYVGTDITREIVCKVDFTAYNKRVNDRKRVAELKKDMDKKVKELQGLELYKMMAEKSPELKAMLSEYEELTNNE